MQTIAGVISPGRQSWGPRLINAPCPSVAGRAWFHPELIVHGKRYRLLFSRKTSKKDLDHFGIKKSLEHFVLSKVISLHSL